MIDLGSDISIRAGQAARQRSNIAPGLLPIRAASLKDSSHLVDTSGSVSFAPGQVTLGELSGAGDSANYEGHIWVHTEVSNLSGTYRPRFLSPVYAPESTRTRDGLQTWKFPAASAQTGLELITGTGGAATLGTFQAYQMDDILSRPAYVIVAGGQSLMECSHNAYGIDPAHDFWPGPRCLCVPGYSYAGFGTTRGALHAMHAPLLFKSQSSGVSPAIAFAQELMPFVPESHNLVIVCAAYSATTLVGSDGDWNPAGSGQNVDAYQNAVDLIADTMAALPAGSEIKAWLWAQGQGDLSPTMDVAYPAAFAAMRNAMESDTGSGQVPWMLFGPPPDATSIHTDLFVETFANMDQDSGHATAQPMAHTVAHPPGYMEDAAHVTAWGSRVMGKLVARRFIEEGYL
ncbi:sialate O-acetylesterase [Cognatishimia sp. SS12]|uniref:sialate O-acetylesterase n=1 Tax=Cognatishimia sp. SS12 TaxID=2979465 RepID=UPI00232DDE08|nr:sialate O-acetylesterase [Cognatishimia sp. SS12]MDC0738512.1 sialate O-acetylesterase [Cognatishimia sp. SS12]